MKQPDTNLRDFGCLFIVMALMAAAYVWEAEERAEKEGGRLVDKLWHQR